MDGCWGLVVVVVVFEEQRKMHTGQLFSSSNTAAAWRTGKHKPASKKGAGKTSLGGDVAPLRLSV